MSEMVAEIAALLEAFSEEQGRRALNETRRTRMTLTRAISGGFQLGFETVVDQEADKAEIDAILDRMVGAAERQEAIAQLEQDHANLLIEEGLLAAKIKDLARRQAEYGHDNETASKGRRELVVLTKQQRANLDQMRIDIEGTRDQLTRRRERMAVCRRVVAGERRLDVAEKDAEGAAEKAA